MGHTPINEKIGLKINFFIPIGLLHDRLFFNHFGNYWYYYFRIFHEDRHFGIISYISLEKKAQFPKHTSPRDTNLIVLEGEISFFINNKVYKLSKYQVFGFPKNEDHWVEAIENSKFLIVR